MTEDAICFFRKILRLKQTDVLSNLSARTIKPFLRTKTLIVTNGTLGKIGDLGFEVLRNTCSKLLWINSPASPFFITNELYVFQLLTNNIYKLGNVIAKKHAMAYVCSKKHEFFSRKLQAVCSKKHEFFSKKTANCLHRVL